MGTPINRLAATLNAVDGVTVNGCFQNTCSVVTHVTMLETLVTEYDIAYVYSNIVRESGGKKGGKRKSNPSISSASELVDSGASRATRADTARQTYNVTGQSVKVGVLSDSFACESLLCIR